MNLLRIASYLFTAVITTSLIAQESNTPTQTDWIDLYEPQDDAIMIHSLMKPLDYEPGHIYPVIVSLHGGGGRGTDNRRQLKIWNQHLADEDVRRNYPCYVLAPQVTELYQKSDLEKIQQIILCFMIKWKKTVDLLNYYKNEHVVKLKRKPVLKRKNKHVLKLNVDLN